LSARHPEHAETAVGTPVAAAAPTTRAARKPPAALGALVAFPASVDAVERRAALAVGLVVLALAAAEAASLYVPSTWVHRDGRFHVNVAETLFDRASLEQPYARSWYDEDLGWNRTLDAGWSNIALGAHGERYPKHTFVLPLVALPLYAALGLFGTLLTNLLFFGAAGGLGYRFARVYAAPAPAALATTIFLLGSSIREVVYDFHVDALGVALALGALGEAARGRGLPAGVLAGVLVLCRPTHALLVPALGLLLLDAPAPRGRGARLRAVGLALLGGGVVLALGAAANTVMFGRPWLAGYNRTLIVEGGTAKVADVADLFTVPLETGLDRTWNGAFGLRKNHPWLLGLAAPGAMALMFGRPVTALAMLGVSAGTVSFMARYAWEGDRFSWFALAALLPAVATTLDGAARGLGKLFRRSTAPAPLAAGIAAFAGMLLVHFGTRGLGGLGGAWASGRALFTAAVDVPALASGVSADAAVAWPSVARLSVFALAGLTALGLTRAALRVAPAAPAAAAALGIWLLPEVRETLWGGGRPALTVACIALALGAAGAARLGPSILFGTVGAVLAPTPLAVLPLSPVVLLLAVRPAVRDAPRYAGIARLRRAADARATPTPAPPPTAASAAATPPRSAGPTTARTPAANPGAAVARAGLRVVGASVPAALLFLADRASPGGLGALWGRLVGATAADPDPLGMVSLLGQRDDWRSRGGWTGGVIVDDTIFEAVRRAGGLAAFLETPSAARGMLLVLLPLAVAAVLALPRRSRAKLGTPLACASVSFLISPGVSGAQGPVGPLPLVLGVAAVAAAVGGAYGRLAADPGARLRGLRLPAAVLGLALLLVAGGRLARAAEELRPLHLASRRAVRTARVLAGRTPCDFLAWEHYAWECSHLDYGTYALTGLLTDQPPRVGGLPARAHLDGRPPLVVSPAAGRRARRVSWERVRGGSRWHLRYAVPDGLRGDLTLRVAVDGTEVARVDVPAAPTGDFLRLDVPTPGAAGRFVRLELLAEPGLTSTGCVALDGWFEGAPGLGWLSF
jgi:hypothetical protein